MPDYGAGSGPAGFTPVAEGTASTSDAARSLFFDLQTRTFPPLPDGSMQEIHWIDAAVILALGFEVGSIKSAPNTGTDTKRLKRVTLKDAAWVTKDVVKNALDRLTSNGDVLLVRVDVQSTPGRLAYVVVYVNLRNGQTTANPTTVRLTSN